MIWSSAFLVKTVWSNIINKPIILLKRVRSRSGSHQVRDEIGRFMLGSAVAMLFMQDGIAFN